MSLRALLLSLSLILGLAGGVPEARAQTVLPAKDPGDALMKSLLDALKANDHAGFVADGTAKHKAVSTGAFRLMSARFAPMLMQGYKTTVLTTLRKPDHVVVHLWKLEPAGVSEDFELRLVTKGDKIDAFSIL